MPRVTRLAMSESGYLPRLADSMLADALRMSGAVYIRGPKWCGKTATGERQSASQVFMQDPERSAALLELADLRPSVILDGAEPRLIDEWQMAPQLWDAVRFAVDRGKGRGRFILTGSSTPKARPAHSGIGRIASLHMSTMTLYETGESSGQVSLRALFDGAADIAGLSAFSVEDYAYAVCRGGWPEAVTESDSAAALAMAAAYVRGLVERDLEEMDGKVRNSAWMRSLLRSYARNVSTEAAVATIAADMEAQSPSVDTVADYLDALRRASVIEDLEAWSPALRSKTAIRTSPTRHFADPSLAAAVLGISPADLVRDVETFGLLFESLCVHDLRVYAQAHGGGVYHYRDKTGLEADAVVHLEDGRWGAVEVKLGSRHIDAAAKHLRKLAGRVDAAKHGEPAFLMVLTAGAAAYLREDGVAVVPLAMLGP